MNRLGALLRASICLLLLAASGCRALPGKTPETDEPEPARTTEDWASAHRAADKETKPLGLSDRAREIERSVGVGR